MGFPGDTSGKEPTYQCRKLKSHGLDPWVRKIPLEEEMASHSIILAWRTPWTWSLSLLCQLLPGVK